VDILVILIPAAVGLGAVFAVLFVAAVRAGQFDDLDDPPERILHD
jgi:cbb3-type cytochrome oxidase maturation protein